MKDLREKRKRRVKAKIFGTKERPRLSVFRSNKHVFVQLIDDSSKNTLLAESDLKIKERKGKTKTTLAFEVGKLMAQKALKKKIKKVIFDRGGYQYHGRVKAVAEGARKAGLSF